MKKRSRLIIYPRFQMTMIVVNIITSLFCLAAVVSQLVFAFEEMRKLGYQSNLAPNQPFFHFLDRQEQTIFKYLLLFFLVGSIASFVATVLYSHRVAGPLVRLRRYFQEIRDTGDIPNTPLKFRKNDYFSDLAPLVNEVVNILNKKS